jgi:hypothetical protein
MSNVGADDLVRRIEALDRGKARKPATDLEKAGHSHAGAEQTRRASTAGRAVGSTLLLKGLGAGSRRCSERRDSLDRRNLYVAMTRRSKRLTICSKSRGLKARWTARVAALRPRKRRNAGDRVESRDKIASLGRRCRVGRVTLPHRYCRRPARISDAAARGGAPGGGSTKFAAFDPSQFSRTYFKVTFYAVRLGDGLCCGGLD